MRHHLAHKKHQDVAAGFVMSDLNPLPHLQAVKSLDAAKEEAPWIAGTAAALGALAYGAWKLFHKKGRR